MQKKTVVAFRSSDCPEVFDRSAYNVVRSDSARDAAALSPTAVYVDLLSRNTPPDKRCFLVLPVPASKLASDLSLLTSLAEPNRFDPEIRGFLLAVGIPAHLRGFEYFRQAILCVLERPELIGGVTTELYPAVAARLGSTASRVERSMRHALGAVDQAAARNILAESYGIRIPHLSFTNSSFIALAAEHILLCARGA